ncbi:unnamed protein product, partial [Fusarium graminearum]
RQRARPALDICTTIPPFSRSCGAVNPSLIQPVSQRNQCPDSKFPIAEPHRNNGVKRPQFTERHRQTSRPNPGLVFYWPGIILCMRPGKGSGAETQVTLQEFV